MHHQGTERMPTLVLKQQPRGKGHSVSKPVALFGVSGALMDTAVRSDWPDRVSDQHSWLPDADTSSVPDAGPCVGEIQMNSGAEADGSFQNQKCKYTQI